MYSVYNIFKLRFWFRGVPVKNYERTSLNNDSVLALIGIKIHNVSVNYSYDFGVSKLAPYSGGPHELNLTLFFPDIKNKKIEIQNTPLFGLLRILGKLRHRSIAILWF